MKRYPKINEAYAALVTQQTRGDIQNLFEQAGVTYAGHLKVWRQDPEGSYSTYWDAKGLRNAARALNELAAFLEALPNMDWDTFNEPDDESAP